MQVIIKNQIKHILNEIVYYFKRLIFAFVIFAKNSNVDIEVKKGESVKVYSKYILIDVMIGDYSYIASNSNIRNTVIGKYAR